MEGYGENEKTIYIKNSNSDPFKILMLSIVIFVCFGCSFLTLFLNAKKLNKLFNILIFLFMITIIILLHVLIYDKASNIKNLLNELLSELISDSTKIKTTETAGYSIMMTCTVLMFITIVSSFMFHK